MNKDQIVAILEEKHVHLFEHIAQCSDKEWNDGPLEKWTFGQHVLHLSESLTLLNKALSYPKFILKYKFGIANRPLRDYDEIVLRYKEKLAANKDRAKQFNSKLSMPAAQEKEKLVRILQLQKNKLQKTTLKWKDKDLDRLLIPHPLMGRMPVREIIMWTAHHTEHHTQILKNKYS